MSDSVRPHRRQPTRLPCPWDSLGKSGVGYHFLLQCMKVKSESEVAQSCPTLRNPMDCSPSGSSVHGIFQARVLEWGAITFSASSLELGKGDLAYGFWRLKHWGEDSFYCPHLTSDAGACVTGLARQLQVGWGRSRKTSSGGEGQGPMPMCTRSE